MSRLIVKNLPRSITEKKLKEAFSAKGGEISDIQLKFTKEGVFRQFGFVGFKDEEHAKAAQKFLDGTYIGASKVKVEVCADLTSKDKPRAWSKYASDSTAFQKKLEAEEERNQKKKKKDAKKPNVKADDILEKYKDDQKFQEFLRIHKRNAAGAWNDSDIFEVEKSYQADRAKLDQDDEDSDDEAQSEEDDDDKDDDEDNVKALSDLDYLKAKTVTETDDVKVTKKTKEPKNESYFTIKISNLPYKVKKKDIKEFLKPLKAKSIRIPRNIKGIAFVGFASEKDRKQSLIKNKSFITGHQVLLKPYVQKEKTDSEAVNDKWKQQEESLKGEETVAESGRIFVRNLTYSVTEEELQTLFSKYGPVTEVNLPIDRITRKVKGFAFVTFVMPQDAVKAFGELDGTTFQGRLLHLIPGKAKVGDDEDDTTGMTFKQKKAHKEKAKANSSHNWNTLFLGSSAVADLMSEKYNVSKSEVLQGSKKQSAAVTLALGETQIVTETRNFLEEQGIALDAFNSPATERSKTVILVKNLPAKTPVEEIRDKFAKFGELGRVVLPPNGITAIVEFLEPSEARKAFKSLAYTKFKNTPLYLEWSPAGTFNKELDPNQLPVQSQPTATTTSSESTAGATLFVKNINFDTTEEALLEHFQKAGSVKSVNISKKRDPKRPENLLSMGYGFVEFISSAGADQALKTLQHKMLEGHSLELKRSTRATVDEKSKRQSVDTSKQASSKILVRNVPFEATEKDIKDIFKTFGLLKKVRLPKKVTGSHRGFCFVEFASVEEAKKAFEALCHSTHLYGRRLVLEWAEQEETIEDVRKRTATHFNQSEAKPNKRVKKAKLMEDAALAK